MGTESTGKASTALTPFLPLTWVWPNDLNLTRLPSPYHCPCSFSPTIKTVFFTDDLHAIDTGEANLRSTSDLIMFDPPVSVDPQSLG